MRGKNSTPVTINLSLNDTVDADDTVRRIKVFLTIFFI